VNYGGSRGATEKRCVTCGLLTASVSLALGADMADAQVRLSDKHRDKARRNPRH